MLIPIGALVSAVRSARCDVAEALGVDDELLTARLDHLHPSEWRAVMVAAGLTRE